MDVYYRIQVDAKVPWGLLKPSLKRHYQGTLMWAALKREGGLQRGCRRRKRKRGKGGEERRSLWNSQQKEGINRASTSGLPQQNICATSGKIPWNLRVPSFHFRYFFLLFFFFLFYFFSSVLFLRIFKVSLPRCGRHVNTSVVMHVEPLQTL